MIRILFACGVTLTLGGLYLMLLRGAMDGFSRLDPFTQTIIAGPMLLLGGLVYVICRWCWRRTT